MCVRVFEEREREREREREFARTPTRLHKEYTKSFLSLVLKLPIIDKMTTTFDEGKEGKEDDDFSETRRSSSSVPKAKVNNTTREEETLFLYRWTLVYVMGFCGKVISQIP